jgi:hypothetical protein
METKQEQDNTEYPEMESPTLQDEYTQEEINGLIAGVRPESMDFGRFRSARKLIKQGIKGYLKGKYFFVSSQIISSEDGKYYRQTKTYRKEK